MHEQFHEPETLLAATTVAFGGLSVYLWRAKQMWQKRAVAAEGLNDLEPKTGLMTYPAFSKEVERRTAHTQRAGDSERTHSLIMCDLDDFKALNTILNHSVTDAKALLPAAEILKHTVRPENDLACRFGGEEFVVYLGDTDRVGAQRASERIQSEINAIEPIAGNPLGMTMAYVEFPQGTEHEPLMERLSEAITLAKQVPGKNQIFEVS